jgi:hypothetical protein
MLNVELLLGLLGIVGTLAGTYIGFLLSERATKRREAKTEEKQASAVRMILSREIAQNIQYLVEYMENVKEVECVSNPKGDPDVIRMSNLRKFAVIPYPPFSRLGFESQLPILALSLDGYEVPPILQFYSRIEKLQKLQLAMVQMLNDQTAASDKAISGGMGQYVTLAYLPRRPFDENAPDIWEEFREIAGQLIRNGNPIGDWHLILSR